MLKAYQRLHENILSGEDIAALLELIEANPTNDGFGVRYFLRDNPTIHHWLLQHQAFGSLLRQYFTNPCIIKSIYFDKPPKANWPVNWHQDITLNLTNEVAELGFQNWRHLPDRVVVQPPIEVLQSILTFRIHLDETDERNGALSVIEGSEHEGIVRLNQDYLRQHSERISTISVPKGGVMLMSPLTIHSSRRVQAEQRRRRVIHLEVMEAKLASQLPFLERFSL